MKIEGNFRIQVKMLQGIVFTYNSVKAYSIEEGDFVTFIDSKTNKQKKFHASNCEIQDMDEVN